MVHALFDALPPDNLPPANQTLPYPSKVPPQSDAHGRAKGRRGRGGQGKAMHAGRASVGGGVFGEAGNA